MRCLLRNMYPLNIMLIEIDTYIYFFYLCTNIYICECVCIKIHRCVYMFMLIFIWNWWVYWVGWLRSQLVTLRACHTSTTGPFTTTLSLPLQQMQVECIYVGKVEKGVSQVDMCVRSFDRDHDGDIEKLPGVNNLPVCCDSVPVIYEWLF